MADDVLVADDVVLPCCDDPVEQLVRIKAAMTKLIATHARQRNTTLSRVALALFAA
jgi:hypothetical protein